MAHVPPIFVAPYAPPVEPDDEARSELARWARDLPRPRAILAVSAGWRASAPTRGTTRRRPSTRYPAPGAPELAYELHGLLPVDRAPERGWDEGVLAPIEAMFPTADVPVLQLSLVAGARPRALFALGRRVGVLAERGVLVLGSGAFTADATASGSAPDAETPAWARELDAWLANALADAELDAVLAWRAEAPSSPRPLDAGHLDPLFVVAGAASLYDHAVGFPIRGFTRGAVSRRCVQFGR